LATRAGVLSYPSILVVNVLATVNKLTCAGCSKDEGAYSMELHSAPKVIIKKGGGSLTLMQKAVRVVPLGAFGLLLVGELDEGYSIKSRSAVVLRLLKAAEFGFDITVDPGYVGVLEDAPIQLKGCRSESPGGFIVF